MASHTVHLNLLWYDADVHVVTSGSPADVFSRTTTSGYKKKKGYWFMFETADRKGNIFHNW